jgi:hypothetical protein
MVIKDEGECKGKLAFKEIERTLLVIAHLKKELKRLTVQIVYLIELLGMLIGHSEGFISCVTNETNMNICIASLLHSREVFPYDHEEKSRNFSTPVYYSAPQWPYNPKYAIVSEN